MASRFTSRARIACVLAGLGLASCEGPARPGLAAQGQRHGILGGVESPADEAVFQIVMSTNSSNGTCSATLIHARTLLTAAHCLVGATWVEASNEMDRLANPQTPYHALLAAIHQDYNSQTNAYDVGLLQLDSAPPVTPKPWNSARINGFEGEAVRAVGYGYNQTQPFDGVGIRREVSLQIQEVLTDHFSYSGGPTQGICFGDSGGPGLHTFPDGIERVIGVHSFGIGDCELGFDQRVDRVDDFIREWLSTTEGVPWCGKDSFCVAGCTTTDPDCYCQLDWECRTDCIGPDRDCPCMPDGQCRAECEDLSRDPDCPVDCVPDNVCSLQTCPRPDSDCIALGSFCASETACFGRLCLNDSWHPTRYCSKVCVEDKDCPAYMACVDYACHLKPPLAAGDLCGPQTLQCPSPWECNGPTEEDTTCVMGCGLNRSCDPQEICTSGVHGHYCAPRPPKPAPQETTPLPEPLPEQPVTRSGCSSTQAPWLPAVLGLVVLLRKRQRRRSVAIL